MNKVSKQIIDCFERGGKVILFGNGGSLADASHFSAEFHHLGPVIALNDPAKITSIANDFGYQFIFSRQIQDIARPEDLVIGLSSSGNSVNVNMALDMAKEAGIETIDFPRQGKDTQEVQNYQYKLLHDIYLEVKKSL